MAIAVGCDQVTKAVARHVLEGTGMHQYLGGLLLVVYTENSGAFLSLGDTWPAAVRQIVFVFFSALILAATIGYTLLSRTLSKGATVGLACIVGGGLGNMVDRIARGGMVTDFLNVGIGPVRTGIFNVADLFITTGAAILLISYLQIRRRNRAQNDNDDSLHGGE